ncbi:hypothetical protein BDV93DRAFT_552825 [Ceratobasidium sp. AG-I]|nr:hypothetical protein BDV93DRAFT_552825 [Ceratobasidium sp. AG-I]
MNDVFQEGMLEPLRIPTSPIIVDVEEQILARDISSQRSPTPTLPASPANLVYQDMGEYLSDFGDACIPPEDITVELQDSPVLVEAPLEQTVLAPQIGHTNSVSATPIPNPPFLENRVIWNPAQLFGRDFGGRREGFASLLHNVELSGQYAVQGARLYKDILQHFRIPKNANNPVEVEGVMLSSDGVAEWLFQTPGTMRNWCTLEKKVDKELRHLDGLEERLPRNDRRRRMLQSLFEKNAHVNVAKQNALVAYLDAGHLID